MYRIKTQYAKGLILSQLTGRYPVVSALEQTPTDSGVLQGFSFHPHVESTVGLRSSFFSVAVVSTLTTSNGGKKGLK